MDEHRRAIDEVVGIAEREQVDLVVHSGDVFERPLPPIKALALGLDGLVRLTGGGRRPVVAIAGNHDSPDLFDSLAKFLVDQNVHLVGEIKSPDRGGVLDLATAAGRAVVACLSFLREGRTFNAWQPPGETYAAYTEKVGALLKHYERAATHGASGDAVTVLVAHFLVDKVKVQGHGAARGERELHMGHIYAVDSGAIPVGFQYGAIGHVHAPQRVPGTLIPAEYAGSLLQLDFGEAGEEKRVVLVDAVPGLPAQVRSAPIRAGRPLKRPTGTWEEILSTAGLDRAYLDLTVQTDGPDPGLADRARDRFEFLVKVRTDYPRAEVERRSREGRSIVDLYHDYYLTDEGVEPPAELIDALRGLVEEVTSAPA